MILSSPGILSRSRDAAEPALAGPASGQRAGQRAPRAARLAAALAGLVAIGGYLFVALRRLDYPFALEWLEGNSLVEVHRILAGQPLYPAPSATYVPDGYPPLYFYVSAAVARVLGPSYLSLRLVSLVSSLACFALLARLVQRETGSVAAGTGAAGAFAATYFVAGAWFDIGRVDSLFLALSVGGLYAARHMRRARGAVAAGALLAAAALTKQTGLAEVVAVTAVLLPGPRRRLACVAALTEVTVLGASALALRFTSGGWFSYYIVKQMSEHGLTGGNFGWFWTALLTATGLAACAAVTGARRVPRELLAGCAALVVEGYTTLVHSGGSIADMLPAYLAMALLAGLALGCGAVPGGGAVPGLGGRARAVPGVLVLAQIVFLLASSHPAQAIPTSADRAAGQRLLAGMRAFGGDVTVPDDPGLSLLAGMAPSATPGAVYDVLRATDKSGIESYRDSAYEAVKARRFSAIVADGGGQPLYNPPDLLRDYQECKQPLPAGPATLLVPFPGSYARPAVVWIPRGSGSCQAAIAVLDGGKAAGLVRSVITGPRLMKDPSDPSGLPGPFRRSFWRSPVRGPWLTSVFGLMLLVSVPVMFGTGLLSYDAYNPNLDPVNDTTPDKGLLGFYLFSWPTHPYWLYRVTQGVHVTLGLALVPILLFKLWSVLPKLFEWPPLRSYAHLLERLSLFMLVGGAVFEFVTGILNIQTWYPFPASFYTMHLYGAWVFMAGFVVHVAIKFPVMIRALRSRAFWAELRTNLADTRPEPPEAGYLAPVAPAAPTISRRGVLAFAGAGSALVAALSVGQSLGGSLRKTALLAPHDQQVSGTTAGDFQVNNTARNAGIVASQTGESWRLTVKTDDQQVTAATEDQAGRAVAVLSRGDLLGMEQHTARLPIMCVEGWSTDNQTWTGVRLRDLAALSGVTSPSSVLVQSLQHGGGFSRAALSTGQIMDQDSLLALRVNGADLTLDHGYPARVIVPGNPGVHNTKWVASLTFRS